MHPGAPPRARSYTFIYTYPYTWTGVPKPPPRAPLLAFAQDLLHGLGERRGAAGGLTTAAPRRLPAAPRRGEHAVALDAGSASVS